MKYPKPMDVDWKLLSTAAKTILLQFGNSTYLDDVAVEDRLIKITFNRGLGTRSSELEVTRKRMPDHPKEHLRRTSNPFYMEHGGECIRTHGEGIYVYRYILELSRRNNPNPEDWGVMEEALWI